VRTLHGKRRGSGLKRSGRKVESGYEIGCWKGSRSVGSVPGRIRTTMAPLQVRHTDVAGIPNLTHSLE